MIELRFLDHVAIHVAELERSAAWYEQVLGLKRYTFKEWGAFPIFMLSGKCGVAIFPAAAPQTAAGAPFGGIRIDHFAFNVDRENFEKARQRYEALGLVYNFQDHVFFHSIYTLDPDGHKVELTTMVVEENAFYCNSTGF
jgi:catechol 2,3-dioxygenase-like lactoylglutathione lyase family enzyme